MEVDRSDGPSCPPVDGKISVVIPSRALVTQCDSSQNEISDTL